MIVVARKRGPIAPVCPYHDGPGLWAPGLARDARSPGTTLERMDESG
jgi:hypothetical protein